MAPCIALLSVAVVVASLMAGAAAMEQVLSVGKFHGVAVSGGVEVHAEVNASMGSSVRLQGESGAVSGVTSSVDFWGTLLLGRTEGAAAGRVVAKVTVPRPLTFAGAAAGSSLFADSVSGTVVVASHSQIRIKQLNSSNSTSIVATDRSYVNISEGQVPYIATSASSHTHIDLGGLRAETASISVSSNSSIFNGTVSYAIISASSNAFVRMTMTGGAGISCSQAEIHLSGGARVTEWSKSDCSMSVAVGHAPPAEPADDPDGEAPKDATLGIAMMSQSAGGAQANATLRGGSGRCRTWYTPSGVETGKECGHICWSRSWPWACFAIAGGYGSGGCICGGKGCRAITAVGPGGARYTCQIPR